jgi:tRNA pseudouridine38-40 synthase
VGWQTQPNGPSVQAALEEAMARLCGEPVRIAGAGRTDAGVHARGQVASLLPPRELPLKAWTVGLNGLLPPEISCVRAEVAPDGFDARRWARGKRYQYSLLQTRVRSPLRRGRVWEIRRPLDLAAMRAAAAQLIGRHDFSSLRAANCHARTTVREIRRLDISDNLVITVEATAFLKHMVRNIVGTLVSVGHGARSPESMVALLASGDRTLAGVTAPPHGLVLDEVFYLPGNADPRAGAPTREGADSPRAGPAPAAAAPMRAGPDTGDFALREIGPSAPGDELIDSWDRSSSSDESSSEDDDE